ncbi:MAG: Na/Pi symporter [Pirellula sp.]
MNLGILEVLGGIGLFLLGMAVMTDGLNRLAGESLRRTLSRFTKTPWTGTLTGMIVTALIQSSSATTVMAVGFVGAGLLTFPQALSIILGANIGTTATGWVVALFGFTFSLKNIALPLLFLGALLRMGRVSWVVSTGYAISGFGAVFIGIGMLQHGMEAYKDMISPEIFPPDTIVGRLQLLLMGIAITLVTQSSSVGVATAITAVHVGSISLSQAAAIVIGMDIGTTVTALLASLGGNVNARRTGWSHVIYNVITGIAAFVLLPLYMVMLTTWAPAIQRSSPELALVGFHSLFNTLGVLIVLPITMQFAAFVTYIVPGGESRLTERLEPSLLKHPQIAIENVLVSLRDVSQVVFSSLAKLLTSRESEKEAWARLDEAAQAVDTTRLFLNLINDPIAVEKGFYQKVVALHLLDHLARLIVRIRKQGRLQAVLSAVSLTDQIVQLASLLSRDLSSPAVRIETNDLLKKFWAEIELESDRFRHEAIERTVQKEERVEELISRLDGVRWLQRITYHSLRIAHYLSLEAIASKSHESIENLDDESIHHE